MPLAPMPGIQSFSMNPKRMLAASGSYDGSVLLWNLDPGQWLRQACAIANRNLSCVEWFQFMGDRPYQSGVSGAPLAEGVRRQIGPRSSGT
jgi:hypothetical protein